MRKRFLAILLASVLVVVLLPVMAFADEEIPAAHDLKVKKLDSDGTTEIDASMWADYSWDDNTLIIPKSGLIITGTTATEHILVAPDVTELTLSGMKIIPTAGMEEGILINEEPSGPDSDGICTITLIGENQIGNAVTYNEETTKRSDYFVKNGIFADGGITFTGSGSLTIYDKETGIKANNVTFGKNFSGKLTIEDFGYDNCAINSSGDVLLLGGTFDLKSYKKYGINAKGNVEIKNAKLSIYSEKDGIKASGNVEITSCPKISITSKKDEPIDANGTLTIKDCPDFNVVADDDDALRANGNLTIDNSTVDVTADIDGLDTEADAVIKGGSKVTVHADDEGIICTSLTVEGANTVLYAIGDCDNTDDGYGILFEDKEGKENVLTVTGGTVKITGSTAISIEGDKALSQFLPAGVTLMANTAKDTFTNLQEVTFKSVAPDSDFPNEKYMMSYIGDAVAKSVMIECPKEEKPDKTKNTVVIEINGSSLPMTPEKEENPNTGAMDLKPMAVMGTIIALSALAFAGKKH